MRLLPTIRVKARLISILPIVLTSAMVEAEAETITIHTDQVIRENFGGLGFGWDGWSAPIDESMFVEGEYPSVSNEEFAEVFESRWKELNPSLLRCQFGVGWYLPEPDTFTWESPYMRSLYRILDVAQATGTQVYLSDWAWIRYQPEWLTGGHLDFGKLDHDLWAKVHVDGLYHLIKTKGYSNIKWWGNTNEMQDESEDEKISFQELKSVMESFKAELSARKLDDLIQTLATDQSWYYKYEGYSSIKWASEHMDEVSDIYGAHRYANSKDYEVFIESLKLGVSYAGARGKDFLIGEFGDQDYERDAVDYGRRLCEIAVAGINAGVYGMCSWVLTDADYDYGTFDIDWGLFRDKQNGYTTKPAYYAYGLLTKYFRPESTVYSTSASLGQAGVYSACTQDEGGRWTIALINNNEESKTVTVQFSGTVPEVHLRKYVFDPKALPTDEGGKLQASEGSIAIGVDEGGRVTLPGRGVVVLTNNPDRTGRDLE